MGFDLPTFPLSNFVGNDADLVPLYKKLSWVVARYCNLPKDYKVMVDISLVRKQDHKELLQRPLDVTAKKLRNAAKQRRRRQRKAERKAQQCKVECQSSTNNMLAIVAQDSSLDKALRKRRYQHSKSTRVVSALKRYTKHAILSMPEWNTKENLFMSACETLCLHIKTRDAELYGSYMRTKTQMSSKPAVSARATIKALQNVQSDMQQELISLKSELHVSKQRREHAEARLLELGTTWTRDAVRAPMRIGPSKESCTAAELLLKSRQKELYCDFVETRKSGFLNKLKPVPTQDQWLKSLAHLTDFAWHARYNELYKRRLSGKK